MKKIIILQWLILLTLTSFGQNKKVEITPTSSIGKVVLKGKKYYTYYALSGKNRTSYSVRGPGKLVVNVRVRIDEQAFKSVPCKIKYVRSESFVQVEDIPALLVGNLSFKSKSLTGSPTRVYKIEIDVPPGKHVYSFFKYKTEQKLHMRAFYEAYPKPDWEEIIPNPATLAKKDLKFVKSGKTRSYYAITKQSSFNFVVTDTTRLRVVIRPEFSYNMLEETVLKIRFENLETGDSWVYKVNSKKANNIEFVSGDKLTPGTSTIFYVNLEKPAQKRAIYSITLVSGAKGALVRLSTDKNLVL